MSDLRPDLREDNPLVRADEDEAAEPRYQWPPVRDPNVSYKSGTRNPVHAILTALPILMLVTGLYIYYRGESQQSHSAPIMAESVEVSGIFTGLSATSGRHYLWLEVEDVARGVRVKTEQVPLLEVLVRDMPMTVKMAPSVHESSIYWAWYVEQSGNVYLDAKDTLR